MVGIKNVSPTSTVMATACPRALSAVLFLHPRQREMLWGRDPILSGLLRPQEQNIVPGLQWDEQKRLA